MENKYIDADRLRAEIKMAKSVYGNPNRVVLGIADAYRQDGRAAMCDDILKKIDSLQQEQPIGEEYTIEVGKHTYTLRVGSQSDIDRLIRQEKQEQPITEDWAEKRKQECPFRKTLDNNLYGCSRYEGAIYLCDGRCSWIVDYPKLKELKERKQMEMDFEEEWNKFEDWAESYNQSDYPTCYEPKQIARHFYELGLNARKKEDEK